MKRMYSDSMWLLKRLKNREMQERAMAYFQNFAEIMVEEVGVNVQ